MTNILNKKNLWMILFLLSSETKYIRKPIYSFEIRADIELSYENLFQVKNNSISTTLRDCLSMHYNFSVNAQAQIHYFSGCEEYEKNPIPNTFRWKENIITALISDELGSFSISTEMAASQCSKNSINSINNFSLHFLECHENKKQLAVFYPSSLPLRNNSVNFCFNDRLFYCHSGANGFIAARPVSPPNLIWLILLSSLCLISFLMLLIPRNNTACPALFTRNKSKKKDTRLSNHSSFVHLDENLIRSLDEEHDGNLNDLNGYYF